MPFKSKFAGTCKICHKAIDVGDLINWEKGAGATHENCTRVNTSSSPCGNAEMCLPWHFHHDRAECIGCPDLGKSYNELHYFED